MYSTTAARDPALILRPVREKRRDNGWLLISERARRRFRGGMAQSIRAKVIFSAMWALPSRTTASSGKLCSRDAADGRIPSLCGRLTALAVMDGGPAIVRSSVRLIPTPSIGTWTAASYPACSSARQMTLIALVESGAISRLSRDHARELPEVLELPALLMPVIPRLPLRGATTQRKGRRTASIL